MSIEHFFKSHQPGVALATEMQHRREKRAKPSSLVGMLAELIVEEGGNGLRELAAQRLRKGGTMFTNQQDRADYAASRFTNYACVLLGCSVRVVEQTMVEGYFDYSAFIESINSALVGTEISRLRVFPGTRTIDSLTLGELKSMWVTARNDSTFTNFFQIKEGIACLPVRLREFLMHSRSGSNNPFLAQIKEVLPKWQELARPLVADNKYMQVPEVFYKGRIAGLP